MFKISQVSAANRSDIPHLHACIVLLLYKHITSLITFLFSDQFLKIYKDVPFEHYRFNKRAQEAVKSYNQYKTALRKLAEGCEFHTITPEEILHDCLIFGICNVKVQERLLRESQLTLKKTNEICCASESTTAQLKEVSERDTVSAVNFRRVPWRPRGKKGDTGEPTKECGNCGRIHKPNNSFAHNKNG